MGCGCAKKKNSVQADAARAARVNRVVYKQTPTVEGLADTHALSGTSFRAMVYLVAPREMLDAGDFSTAETYTTLASAQKRVRDLGPGYGIKGTRT